MNTSYANINLKTGTHIAGICKIQIAPREWLAENPTIDFLSGKILTPVVFLGSYNWLSLQLVADSYSYSEKPKSSKAGPFIEISISGLINYIDPALLQILETLRNNELIALVTDFNGQLRLVGNANIGLIADIGHVQENKQDGSCEISIEMKMQNSYASPFYTI
jgi:hypothetical protein